MLDHKILRDIFVIGLDHREIWDKIQESKTILMQLKKDYSDSISYLGSFEQNLINPDKHLNFLGYHLKNPKIRVDIGYSILTNLNYELLPESIAQNQSFKKIFEKTLEDIDEMNQERVALSRLPINRENIELQKGFILIKLGWSTYLNF